MSDIVRALAVVLILAVCAALLTNQLALLVGGTP